MKRFLLYTLLILGLLGLGGAISYFITKNNQTRHTQSDAVVILEKMKKVQKLITIEAAYSESYDEENIREVTLYLPFPSKLQFSKTAQIQITGKVLVGFDMSQIVMEVDSPSKTITLKNIPEPEILAIDHDIKYRDVDNSWFNQWEPEDYTQLATNAKNVIRDRVYEDQLLDAARKESDQIIEVMDYMASEMGWKLLIYKRQKAPLQD